MSSRASIAKIFSDILVHGITLDESLSRHKANNDPFIKAHSYGLSRWYFQLDAIAKKIISKPLKEKDLDIYALILLGLHQIFHSEMKDHALVSETVQAAVALKKIWAKGLINACLRRALREKEVLQEKAHPAHPQWMIEHLKYAWPEDWRDIIEANNHQAPMTLRLNARRLPELPTLTAWLEEHEVKPSRRRINSCIYLQSPMSVDDIPGFREGILSVQDEASHYVASLLSLKVGEKVLDACAAPGGKTGHLLEMEPHIFLTATDISESRLQKIKENLLRLRCEKNVILKAVDAGKEKFDKEYFDKILVDAPCSGTGVIRRHPDIKLLRRESDLKGFAIQQMRLLNNLWPALKVSGRLLYTTCSIMPEENEDVIAQFLEIHPDAQVEVIQLPIGKHQKYGWQCFPHIHGHDGFYYCLLSKVHA